MGKRPPPPAEPESQRWRGTRRQACMVSTYASCIQITDDLGESITWRVEEMSVVDFWVGGEAGDEATHPQGSSWGKRDSWHSLLSAFQLSVLSPLCPSCFFSCRLQIITQWRRLTTPRFTLGTLPFPWAGQAGLGLHLPPQPTPPLPITVMREQRAS